MLLSLKVALPRSASRLSSRLFVLQPSSSTFVFNLRQSVFLFSFPLGLRGFSSTRLTSFPLLPLRDFIGFFSIFRFSSPVSRQGWEVFHRKIKLVFLLSFPTGFGRFFINLGSWFFLLTFLSLRGGFFNHFSFSSDTCHLNSYTLNGARV